MNDRLLRACRKEPVDRTPVWFMRQAGRCLPEYRAIRERHSLLEITRQAELCAEVTLQPVDRFDVDAAILFADITLPFHGLGVEFEIRAGVGPVVAHPLRTPADVERLSEEPPEAYVPELLEAIGIIRSRAQVPLIGFCGAPFTMAAYLIEGRPSRKFHLVKGFMRDRPEAWDALMRRLVDADIAYLRAQIDAGAQVVQVFDSWVGALSPMDYDRSVASHMRRLFDAIDGTPTIHFGTNTAGLLERMTAAGGDVIGLDWRIDLAEGWARVGDRAIQGNLDPHALIGSFESVAADSRAILDAAGGRAGHIFNLGHGVLPDTPVDNLRRLVELVHEETA